MVQPGSGGCWKCDTGFQRHSVMLTFELPRAADCTTVKLGNLLLGHYKSIAMLCSIARQGAAVDFAMDTQTLMQQQRTLTRSFCGMCCDT